MTSKSLLLFVVSVLAIGMLTIVPLAQEGSENSVVIRKALRELSTGNISEKMHSLQVLINYLGEDEVQEALVDELAKEKAISESWWKEYNRLSDEEKAQFPALEGGEAKSDYLFDLAKAVISIRKKSPALVRAIMGLACCSTLAIEYLASLGPEYSDVIADAIAKVENLSVLEGLNDAIISHEKNSSYSAKEKKVLQEALLGRVNRTKGPTKQKCVKVLGIIGDYSALEVLKDIAKSDEYRASDLLTKRTIFPVREEATMAIENIHKKPGQR